MQSIWVDYTKTRLLANICYGPQECSDWLMADEILDVFRLILTEPCLYSKTFMNFVWILGNMAGNSIEARDKLMNHPMFEVFLSRFTKYAILENIKDLCWVLRVLIRGDVLPRTYPSLKNSLKLIDIIAALFKSTPEAQVVFETGYSMLYFLLAGTETLERHEILIEHGIFVHLKKCLFEYTLPIKSTICLLHILESYAEAPEDIVLKVFSEESDYEVSFKTHTRTYYGMHS